MKKLLTILVVALMLSVAAVSMAQEAITPGTPITATYAGEPQVYTLDATAGQLLIASMATDAFSGGEVTIGQAGTEIVSGGEYDFPLAFIAQSDGTYEFTVDTWSSDAAGDYTLSVDVAEPTSLPLNEPVTLTPADAETTYVYGMIEATADTVVHINASTSNPAGEDDLRVTLVGIDGEEIENDDDDGFADNSLIRRVVLPSDGLYLVKVANYDDEDFLIDPVNVLVEQTERLFLTAEPQAMVLGDAEGNIGTEVFFIDVEAGSTYRITVTIPSMPDEDVGVDMKMYDTEFFFDPYMETRHTTRAVWEYTAGRTGQIRLDVHPNFFGTDISQIDYTIAMEVVTE